MSWNISRGKKSNYPLSWFKFKLKYQESGFALEVLIPIDFYHSVFCMRFG